MKNYLFATLLLGSLIASVLSNSESFDFIDSQGRCWRCTDGSCSSCPAALLPRPRQIADRNPQDRLCIQPIEADCVQNPIAKFPTPDINMYWDCANNFRIARRCDCDTGFDPAQQMCVKSDEMTSIGCTDFWNGDIFKCGNDGGDNGETTATEATTTTSSTPNPCICIPFWPCRCNPCWSMPCHNCNGCGSMMG